MHVQQWMPYEDKNDLTPVEALQQILDYLNRHEMEALHSSTQIIIAPGYTYKIVKKMVTNFPSAAKYIAAIGFRLCERKLAKDL